MLETSLKKSKAILVSVILKSENQTEIEHSLNELALLAETLDIEVCERFIQKRDKYDPAYLIGTGLLENIKEKISETEADMILFDKELSPAQNRNLEKYFGIKVYTRSEVIINIFALHAKTHEAKLQVELAQLEFMLPRLVGMWSHFDRTTGGRKYTKGMGETQLEIDRRIIKDKISKLKEKLREIKKYRNIQRKQQKNIFKIAIAGYTNAGKSSLFNILSNSDVLVEDKLFATLDSTTRIWNLDGRDILLSDTVGFISRLPHHLIASFRSTLEEVTTANLIIHLVDIADEEFEKHIREVENTFKELKADEIPRILVFNKIDKVNSEYLQNIKERFNNAVFISVLENRNLINLQQTILDFISNYENELELFFPHNEFNLLAKLYNDGKILSEKHLDNGVLIKAKINSKFLKKYEKNIFNNQQKE